MPRFAALALIALRCAAAFRLASDPISRRPRYARVDDSIETLWQRPLTSEVKGVFFAAHGCKHQATDFFANTGHDGFRMWECQESTFGRCLGLPVEREIVRKVRQRGYLFVAVTGTGSGRCWDEERDVERVEKALSYVFEAEGLTNSTPVLAFGASSGGKFMGPLAKKMEKRLTCVAPQISGAYLHDVGVPAVFTHMLRDEVTNKAVENSLKELKSRRVRNAEYLLKTSKVDRELLSRCLPEPLPQMVVDTLKKAVYLDHNGWLTHDPRTSHWRYALAGLIPPGLDSLVADESPLSEMLNVAFARHEIMSSHMDKIMDFCESV